MRAPVDRSLPSRPYNKAAWNMEYFPLQRLRFVEELLHKIPVADKAMDGNSLRGIRIPNFGYEGLLFGRIE